MAIPLRILIIEDNEDDALLVIRELHKGGFDPTFERVDTAEAMSEALGRETWDVVLSDFNMPHFGGLGALKLFQEKGPDIPFIIVSGTIGEEAAVAAMVSGAHDYVMKNNLPRLVPAIQRELREAESRRERRLAIEALKESEKRYRLLAENVDDVIFVLDTHLNYRYVSPSVKTLRGYEPEELLEHSSIEMLTPSSRDLAVRTFSAIMELERSGRGEAAISRTLELEMGRKDGTTVWTEVKFSSIRDKNQRLVGITGVTRDITERKQGLAQLRQAEERYRNIFENAQEGIFQSTPEGRIVLSNKAAAHIYGYLSPEDLMASIYDLASQHYVAPEERREILETIEKNGFIKGHEVQHYKKDKSIIWASLTMQAIRDEKGKVVHYDGILEDITNRKQAVEQIRRALKSTVRAIAVTVETRDPYTAGHQRRVADLARMMAIEMNLPNDTVEGILMTGSLHDLGKISVPAELLSKPTKLTDIEFMLIKTHSQCGYDILKDIDFPWPVARIVLEHHERMNGSGYPNGLVGDDLLMESRIIAVADVVEAMASDRPYRPALGIDAALNEISRNKGILYDPGASDACLRLFHDKGYRMID